MKNINQIRLVLGIAIVVVLLAGFVMAADPAPAAPTLNQIDNSLLGITAKDAKIEATEGVTPGTGQEIGTIKFTGADASVKIKGVEFANIQPAVANEKLAYIKVDKNGNISEADFYTNEKGGTYTFGNDKFYVPPNSRVFYNAKNGQIQITAADGSKFDTAGQMPGKADGSKTSSNLIEITGKNIVLANGNVMQDGTITSQNGNLMIKQGSTIDNLKIRGREGTSVELYLTGEPLSNDPTRDGKDYISLNANTGKMVFQYDGQKNQGKFANGIDSDLNVKRGIDFLNGNPFLPVESVRNNRASVETLDGKIQGTIVNNFGTIPQLTVKSFATVSGTPEKSDYTIANGNQLISYNSRKSSDVAISLAKDGNDFNSVPMTMDLTYRRSGKDVSLLGTGKVLLMKDDNSYGIVKASALGDDAKLSTYNIDNDWSKGARDRMQPVPDLPTNTPDVKITTSDVTDPTPSAVTKKVKEFSPKAQVVTVLTQEQQEQFLDSWEEVGNAAPNLLKDIEYVAVGMQRETRSERADIWNGRVGTGASLQLALYNDELDPATIAYKAAGARLGANIEKIQVMDFFDSSILDVGGWNYWKNFYDPIEDFPTPEATGMPTIDFLSAWKDIQSSTGYTYTTPANRAKYLSDNAGQKVNLDPTANYGIMSNVGRLDPKEDIKSSTAIFVSDPTVLDGLVKTAEDIQGKTIGTKTVNGVETPIYGGNPYIQKLILLRQGGFISREQYNKVVADSHLRIDPTTGKPF